MNFDILGVLLPNVFTMAVQLCSTLVLFLLCKKLLWKPARNIIKARQDKMKADLEEADKARAAAGEELAQAKRSLEEAREKSGEIVSAARNEAEELKKTIVDSAKAEARNRITDADQQINKMYKDAQDSLKDEIVDVALAAVSKLLEEKADSETDNEALRRYVDEVRK